MDDLIALNHPFGDWRYWDLVFETDRERHMALAALVAEAARLYEVSQESHVEAVRAFGDLVLVRLGGVLERGPTLFDPKDMALTALVAGKHYRQIIGKPDPLDEL